MYVRKIRSAAMTARYRLVRVKNWPNSAARRRRAKRRGGLAHGLPWPSAGQAGGT